MLSKGLPLVWGNDGSARGSGLLRVLRRQRNEVAGGDDNPAQRLLHQAEVAAERQTGILRVAIGAGLLVTVELVAPHVPQGASAILREIDAARITVVGLALVGILTLVGLRRGYPVQRLSYVTATADAVLILGNLSFSLFAFGIPGNFFSLFPGVWIVPIALAATALRYRPALQIYVATLYVVGLTALMLVAGIIPPDQRAPVLAQLSMGFGPPPNAIRLVMIAIAATVLVVVASRGRRLLHEVVRETTVRLDLTRFLPQELAPILTDPAFSELRTGRRQTIALLFVDVRGSTAMAEHLDSARFAAFMSAFRRRVMDAAVHHGGVVDKFIGDGALIVFGLPYPSPDDAARALACARTLDDLIARWNAKRQFDPPVTVGIGVHVGEVFCGVVGDARRFEFTVMGDPVNVAARLQEATKEHGVAILASDAVVRAGGEEGHWREVERTPLRGRREVLGLMAPIAA
jgi:adenylate cyclase